MSVVVRLTGGLGNQMFQFALGRRLELVNGADVRYDTSWFEPSKGDHMRRAFGLGLLGAEVRRASAEDIRKAKHGTAWRERLHALHPRLSHDRSIREKGSTFEPAVLHVKEDTYLDGYWQSERYFADVADRIREEFTPSLPADLPEGGLVARMAVPGSVSLHVRRGDYVSHAAAAHFVSLGMDYYSKAIAYLRERVPDARFFIFSDDTAWVRDNLRIEAPHEIVPARADRPAHVDLLMMARCRHHVIANSSFSWWGAWLNSHKEKHVVAPLHWSTDPAIDTRDLVPADWTRL